MWGWGHSPSHVLEKLTMDINNNSTVKNINFSNPHVKFVTSPFNPYNQLTVQTLCMEYIKLYLNRKALKFYNYQKQTLFCSYALHNQGNGPANICAAYS